MGRSCGDKLVPRKMLPEAGEAAEDAAGRRWREDLRCSEGVPWSGLAGAARAGGLHGPRVSATHPASPSGPSEAVPRAFVQSRLCQHPASMAGCFPLHHRLQFLFQTSGWKCPTRCLPPVELCFGKYQRKKKTQHYSISEHKTKEKYVVLSTVQKSLQLFQRAGLHAGAGGGCHTIRGACHHPAGTQPGSAPWKKPPLTCALRLLTAFERKAAQMCCKGTGSFPLQLPLLL